VLSTVDWAEVRRLRRSKGVSISEIAQMLTISRNTVKVALASDGPPKYRRRPAGSVVDGSSRGSGSCCRRIQRCRRR
jgi:hypothetical protein